MAADEFVSKDNLQKAVIMLILSKAFHTEFMFKTVKNRRGPTTRADKENVLKKYNLWLNTTEMDALIKLGGINRSKITLTQIDAKIAEILKCIIPQTVVIRT